MQFWICIFCPAGLKDDSFASTLENYSFLFSENLGWQLHPHSHLLQDVEDVYTSYKSHTSIGRCSFPNDTILCSRRTHSNAWPKDYSYILSSCSHNHKKLRWIWFIAHRWYRVQRCFDASIALDSFCNFIKLSFYDDFNKLSFYDENRQKISSVGCFVVCHAPFLKPLRLW